MCFHFEASLFNKFDEVFIAGLPEGQMLGLLDSELSSSTAPSLS